MMDVKLNIRNGVYEPENMGRFTKPIRPTMPARGVETYDKIIAYAEALKVYETAKTFYDSRKVDERKERAELMKKFRHDLSVEFIRPDHPKEPLLYQMAYDRASSEGLLAIYHEYDVLSELVS